MVNILRGEIEARLDGKSHCLCLTLGALAELEQAFGDKDILAVAERFETGRMSASDAILIIAAGLRGGGADFSNEAVAAMKVEGGATGYVRLVGDLLKATFAPFDADVGDKPVPQPKS